MKIAVIGGVAAGTSAAAKARREDKEAEIVLLEKDNNISYAGCGLPYYISGVVDSREKVEINTPREFEQKYGVRVKTKHEVMEIDIENKRLIYRNLNLQQKNTEEYKYDKLIIATGASPVIPPIPGIELKNIVTLRTLADAEVIKSKINNKNISRVCIVGAGLVGLEMAEAFKKLDKEVTVIEKLSRVLPQFGENTADIVEENLRENEVNLILNEGVKKFKGNNEVNYVITEKDKKIAGDLVLISTGIKPNVELAREAGIKIGETGAVKVNEKMETSEPDIYAAGDCVESKNLITGKPEWVPLGSTANKQGRVVGENAAGGNNIHRGILKTTITKIFDLTVGRTGLSENEAETEGFNPIVTKIEAADHAGYYPDVTKLYLEGVFDLETGRILGVEIVGKAGVDKRIDVLSTAIYGKLTAHDLFEVDLGYAPPYSTPKDPVAVLGMVAEKSL